MNKKLMEEISRIQNIATFGDFGRKYDDEDNGRSIREGENDQMDGDDPCWEGYEMVGMKKDKNGKEVPNCVPINEARIARELFVESLSDGEILEEAEYQGREVELNKPFRDSGGPKKFGVYVKDGDSVKKVSFGSSEMEIKRDDPEARKSFRARHNCDSQNDKTTAAYWSCKMWQSGKSVDDMLSEAKEIMRQINEELRFLDGDDNNF